MEIKTETKQIEVDFECPECKNGKLRPTGEELETFPIQYPHKCNECSYTETFVDIQYPYFIYDF